MLLTRLKKAIPQRLVPLLGAFLFVYLTIIVVSHDKFHQGWRAIVQIPVSAPSNTETLEVPVPERPPHPPWKYKAIPEQTDVPLINDNFPDAMHIPLPPIPAWNTLTSSHPPERTPLLIGFTRNWRLLQQAVVSYITAGWPASDIYVVENTGVMDSNKESRLSLQNPFFLNYTRLAMLGVNVVRTATLLNFAQLQNFYLNFAIENQLPAYFWSHMDVIALSDDATKSIYLRALDVYRKQITNKDWAGVFFAYDRLTLVNTQAYVNVGGWDTFIGYYLTDCDFHERVFMHGYKYIEDFAGYIFDVGRSVSDLRIFYREGQQANDTAFHKLFADCDAIQREKNEDDRGRNFWQARQQGGQDDPFYRDSAAFEEAIQLSIAQGKATFAEKWGHRDCDLIDSGLRLTDAWKVEKDF